MNDNELRFLFRRLGIIGIPLAWLCLPALLALEIAVGFAHLYNKNRPPASQPSDAKTPPTNTPLDTPDNGIT
jgi:uncharacterized membrane protein